MGEFTGMIFNKLTMWIMNFSPNHRLYRFFNPYLLIHNPFQSSPDLRPRISDSLNPTNAINAIDGINAKRRIYDQQYAIR